jgi:hypothetical protein
MMFFIFIEFIYPNPDFPDQSQDLAPFPDFIGRVASASQSLSLRASL